MVTSYSRGHKTYYKNQKWRYCDNNEIDDGKRNCARCGKPPTPEGYDACVGYVEGVTSACCGHGVENPYVVDILLTKINKTSVL